jgi:hypothetical protein
VRPPTLAIRMAAGGLAVAATLALGVAGASAAPNPGPGFKGTLPSAPGLITGASDVYPNGGHGNVTDGPQTANVPYLAWAGEAVRLVACDSAISPGGNPTPGQTASWSTENWTGDQADADVPTFDGALAYEDLNFTSGSDGFFPGTDTENTSKGCVDAVIKSTHAGLWQGKLNVYTYDQTNYTEQFIVIWMQANQPTITESSVNSLSYPGGSTVDQLTSTGVTNAMGTDCIDNYKWSDSGLPLSGPYNCLGYLGDPSGGNPSTFNPSLWPSEGGCVTLGVDNSCYDGSYNNGHLAQDTPENNNGLIDVRVTGTFPVEDQPPATTNLLKFGSIDGGINPGSITLPAQWPALAGLLADSSTQGSSPGSNPSLWDIHGGPTNADVHPVINATTTPCPPDGLGLGEAVSGTPLTDAVNNCLGSDFYFSRVFGDVTSGATAPGAGTNPVGPTIGPYDPEAPNETLLSDGKLNADDAPMPALPVTVSIAANLKGTDLGGVGGLYSANKELIYSHNFDGAGTPGNLYNPFYYEYIPATSRDYYESSGVTGIAGDDFPGFDLINKQPYKFWTALDPTTNNMDHKDTICLRRSDAGYQGDQNSGNDYGSQYYPEPSSDQADSVIVYTDERGEAFVDYNPGDGFFLNNLIQPQGTTVGSDSTVPGGTDVGGNVVIGDQGICDLQKLLNSEIGYSSITATAQYPYQGTNYPNPAPSTPLVKVVKSLWNKTLSAYPSYTGGTPTSDFVTTATDINGQPFAGEVICFSVVGTGSGAFTGDVSVFSGLIAGSGGTTVADTIGDKQQNEWGVGNYCVRSNWLGEAGVQVSSSVTGVDVSASFIDEAGLTRDLETTLGGSSASTGTPPVGATVIPQTGAPVASTGTAGGSSSNGSSGSSSSNSGVTGGSTPAITPLVQHASTANVCKVEGLRLVRGRNGKYAASFKLSCASSKSMSVMIRAYRANGKLLRSYRISVRTNKVVSVNVGTKVAHVTVIA